MYADGVYEMHMCVVLGVRVCLGGVCMSSEPEKNVYIVQMYSVNGVLRGKSKTA